MVDREWLIRVSYMEIYNESVCDLLGDPRKHLDVREELRVIYSIKPERSGEREEKLLESAV